MAPEPRPPFATYLLPTFSFPFRRRQSSTSSAASVPSLSNSPNTTPSSSPPNPTFIPPSPTVVDRKGKSISSSSEIYGPIPPLQKIPEQKLPPTCLTQIHPNTLRCITCASDIAFTSQIVSKGFTGRHGRAYLVSPAPGPPINQNSSAKSKTPYAKATDLVNTRTGRTANRELLTGAHVVADVSCLICGTTLGWKYVDAKEAAQKYKIGKFILEMKRVVLGVSWEDGSLKHKTDIGKEEEEDGNGEEEVVFDSGDEDECDELFAGVWDPEVVGRRRGRRVAGRRRGDSD